MDVWNFNPYVLSMPFYRFISENLTSYLNEQERKAGSPDFDYARLSDADAEFGRAETVTEKGFYILPSELFANVRAHARHDVNNGVVPDKHLRPALGPTHCARCFTNGESNGLSTSMSRTRRDCRSSIVTGMHRGWQNGPRIAGHGTLAGVFAERRKSRRWPNGRRDEHRHD